MNNFRTELLGGDIFGITVAPPEELNLNNKQLALLGKLQVLLIEEIDKLFGVDCFVDLASMHQDDEQAGKLAELIATTTESEIRGLLNTWLEEAQNDDS